MQPPHIILHHTISHYIILHHTISKDHLLHWHQIHSQSYLGNQITFVTPVKRLSRISNSSLLKLGLRLGCNKHSSVVSSVLC